MIRNNFSILMAERNTKISQVSASTGISRSTLNQIARNESKMIQLETVNKICQILGTSPDEFFSYLPYDIDTKIESIDFEVDEKMISAFNVRVILSKNKAGRNSEYLLGWDLPIPYNDYEGGASIGFTSIDTRENTPRNPVLSFEDQKQQESAETLWDSLPISFQSDISNHIKNQMIEAAEKKEVNDQHLRIIKLFISNSDIDIYPY